MSTKPKHKGLGRGLDALIQGGATRPGTVKAEAKVSPQKAAPPAEDARGGVRLLPVGRILKSPWQPRREFAADALRELSESIKAKGILQPVLVRKVGEGYELVAGERRFRAAQEAGLTEIPALVQEASDLEAMEIALIENIQREDLNLIEEAEGYRTLMGQAGLTQEDVARRVGKARATVANALRLLDLSDKIKRALAEGTISAGHAKVLLGVDEGLRELLAARVAAQGLSVRALEKLVAGLAGGDARKRKSDPPKGEVRGEDKQAKHLKFLADRMQQELGTKVALSPARVGADGKREMGRIVIEFFDNEDLSRLLETLNLGDLS
jgi:ParB family transcriptional regulator, chromosome partitioning protein